MRPLVPLALLLLGGSPAPVAHPSDEECDRLWNDTVDAAAPDLDPTDELRRGFLLREKLSLTARCQVASQAVLSCAGQAQQACSSRLHAPPDGGNVPGLARCVYPAVQECVQRDRLRQARADGSLDKLLALLQGGQLSPEKGTVKLKGELATLSLGSLALAEKTPAGAQAVLLTFNERNTILRGLWVTTDRAALKALQARPEAERRVKVGGVEFQVGPGQDPGSAEVSAGGK